jgi:hypothetical protein
MSGVSIIRALLAANATVTTLVPASRIMAGVLPQATAMPAIAVTQVSSVPFNLLRTNELNKMHTDRVQVTVLCKDTPLGTGYPGVKSLLRLVLAACPSQRGTVNSVAVDSIVPDIEGPDLYDDTADLHSCSRDFIVKWIAAT